MNNMNLAVSKKDEEDLVSFRAKGRISAKKDFKLEIPPTVGMTNNNEVKDCHFERRAAK